MHYTDTFLSLGVSITRNISVQRSIQIFVLLNKRIKKVLSPYDLQMNNMILHLTVPFSAAANMQQEYDVQVYGID
ncbi:MAG: hypothetical protein ABI707_08120 [Ferruginibacter sp.]